LPEPGTLLTLEDSFPKWVPCASSINMASKEKQRQQKLAHQPFIPAETREEGLLCPSQINLNN